MTKNLVAAAIAVVCSVAFTSSAYAQDSWTETVAFSRSDSSAIKVFEPEGYTASITVGGETQQDQAPTVLRVPNGDAFYVVTIIAPNGAKWSKKIETKKDRVTELRVKHVPATAAAASASKRKFFGKFSMSTKMPCAADGSRTKIEFVTPEGASTASFVMDGDKAFTAEVPEGDYSVRTFRVDPDGTTTYRNTRTGSVKADGWTATVFCHPKGGGADITVK